MMQINLLPPAPPSVRVSFVVFLLAFAVLAIVILYYGVQDFSIWSQTSVAQSDAATYQQKLTDTLNRLSKWQQNQAQATLAQAVSTARSQMSQPVEALSELNKDAPVGGSIQNVTYAGGTFTGNAVVPSFASAANFIARLQSDNMFHNVSVTSIGLGVLGPQTTQSPGSGVTPGKSGGVNVAFSLAIN